MFKHLKITFIVFVLLPCAGILAAQSLNIPPGMGAGPIDYSEYYVNPQEERQPAGGAPAQEGDITSHGPWMICEIKTRGLVNINKKTITKNISARESRLYENYQIQDDVNSLMALGNFDNVEMDISLSPGARRDKSDAQDKTLHPCHVLTAIVTEKPIFEAITYQGRKKLSKNAIQTAMSLKLKDPFNLAKLTSDMERINEAYAQKGYINAKAAFVTEEDPDKNIVTAVITIDEGQRVRVGEVNVEGLQALPLKKFLKQLSNRPGKVYRAQKLPEDHYKATIYARNEGYYDFKITDFTNPESEDKSLINLNYSVHEGHRVKFGDTAYSGNAVYSDEELDKIVFYKKGALYNQQKFDTTVRDIQERYANKGYLRAEIVPVPALDEETGLLNINFDITENNIVFIDHVDVTGNDSTKTYVFTRELTVKEGDVFSYDKIRRSQGKILNLGFINDAQIDITPTNDINKVDVGFNVLEGRPGMFTAGIAMSSLDGLYGDVSVNHLNLFGKAQRLSLRALFGSKILDYTVSWSTPWIFDKPTSFGIDAFNTRRYRSYLTNNSAYTERRIGGRLHLGPRFNDDIYNLGLSYTFESIEVYDINPDIKAGLLAQDGLVEGKNNMSTLGASFAIDTRDNYWDATSGARNSLGVDLSGGPFMGETDIYRFTLRSSYNKTLINIGKDYPIVLMIANRAGMVKPYGGTEVVPAYERVFLGGADTIRGYETTGQIGPQKGGEIYYIGNVELKFPIAREGRRTIAQLAAFFDIGNSWKEWGDIRFKTGPAEDEFKMGFGFGLRFTTPSLPIRLDWGYGLNHKTGEKKSQIYFSMANLF